MSSPSYEVNGIDETGVTTYRPKNPLAGLAFQFWGEPSVSAGLAARKAKLAAATAARVEVDGL